MLSYYDLELTNIPPVDKIELIQLLNAYKATTCLVKKDYQTAADIISYRITNPISEADSLEAVMDLEIVYILQKLDGSKKPLVTDYEVYHYPDYQVFKNKHELNRIKLQAIYEKQKGDQTSIPEVVFLSKNYPNPFNPSTTIEFGVPLKSKVNLRIYNIRGQLVKELVNQSYIPGKYKVVWEGKNSQNKQIASGVYFYRLETGGKCITHKMLLLK
ncbi:MAG TPA: T9SS type A sorting domain-containing protein [Candidatus Cloacimonadota bacterium]|nr:T9SS type A sorting domain-containing protein [Candidatus Cloacimonadota bacterium]HPT72327.1 T9SS type A sorting domain-containing protein [Candidatus Cloacimonadota bacterium]